MAAESSFHVAELLRDHATAHHDDPTLVCGGRVGAAVRLRQVGAAIVPLNSRLAVPELVKLLRDAQVEVLFCGPEFAATAGGSRGECEALREPSALEPADDAWLAGAAEDDPRRDGDSEAVVLQLYTSGTTGLPKGVQTTNANLSLVASSVAEAGRSTPHR